jgi:hypothetical protein
MAQGPRLLISAVFGVAAWVVYYRLRVGPFCPAMWFGTAPPVVMLLAGSALYRALGRRR